MQRLDVRSCMNREIHVQFLQRLTGRIPWSTCFIRQYFPKERRSEEVTERTVKRAKGQLNRRPRKTLGYATPTEVFLGNHSEKKLHFRVESAIRARRFSRLSRSLFKPATISNSQEVAA
jgi:hypothetical protein